MRIGIDVGGTFTDLVALDERGGALIRLKVPTTPRAPEEAVIAALRKFVEGSGAEQISLIAHSSTIATNALLGQINLELPRVALLTTEGFRDVLEIGRQNRSEVYNLFVSRPRPLVARNDRIGVRERLDHAGAIVVPLERASLDAAIAQLEHSDIRAVAVSYLHAYANPAHERETADALRERIPQAEITISSEIDPEYREFERTSTTVVNALLVPLVRRYLEQLEAEVRKLGVTAPLYVMQSNGGMAAIDVASKRPATIIESGPASGVIGAAYLGRKLGIENVLSFDMGGTTAKAGTIFGGEPQVVGEFEAAGRTHSGRAVKGSGYPVRFPFIDLAEVSAGGGTIAWIDAGGALRVGPLSAGADPGPAAYGNGNQPTVTDANIVLGRLNPVAPLGGEMPIDGSRAQRAIDELLRHLPELDRDRLAAGIVALVDNEMAKILRIVSIERGYDPRTFTMMAFGGGGPLHACALAEALEVPRVVVPPSPGLFSAWGLLAADVRASYVRTLVETADAVDPGRIDAAFAQMETIGVKELAAQGVAKKAMMFIREAEMRYLGQGFELSVPFTTLPLALEAFHQKHERTYGYASREDSVEVVAARLVAVGEVAKPALAAVVIPSPSTSLGTGSVEGPRSASHRPVYFNQIGWTDTPIYQREQLNAGMTIEGPAIVEQYDSATLVAPGWIATIDELANLNLERA
ncbi:MAG: hydantoinase/oxoprolinase family protein [Candidatus Eremiobacteraeota bacterium]|nr:hydantoinase/oxoprolinase family protein [Candidatus Eremiobacteraeota bacterium]